ncbi:MAG: CvpA family protein [Gammaproteobacteria bacterium]|nr:CvpA family protein [Gammaproteobacteria bacterium]
MIWTDYLILGLVALSCVYGLVRGLLRELVSLLTWFAAVLLAWRGSGWLEPYLGGALSGAAVRPWAARTLVFAGVMLVGTALGGVVNHYVRLSLFSGIDRLLGFVFGFLRGVVAIGLLAILCHAVRLHDEAWYRKSLLVPWGESAGNVLRSLVGEGMIRVSRGDHAPD